MGCDIHVRVERRVGTSYNIVHMRPPPFKHRNYSVFGFLADVRNYSAVPPISQPRGVPPDINYSEDDVDYIGDHSFSWLSVAELVAFNYDVLLEDRRVTRQIGPNFWDGGATADQGGGRMITFRKFLEESFFNDLERLVASGAERIVFGFDS